MNSPPQESVVEQLGSRNWAELPVDVVSVVLKRLGAIDILTQAQNVCSAWRNICKDPSMWRSVDMRNLGDSLDMEYDLDKICRHAVDRSSGSLLDINIEYFGTDDLLEYVTDRSRHLKRLRLVFCNNISDEGLIEAAAKIPSLEELDLSYCQISEEALKEVGRRCPMLRSFKINMTGYRNHLECNEEALAIAENMPGLRHLQMFGNKLTNCGLQAILHGCPLLESLDLRQCFNVSLEGHLGRRCAEQLKDLRHPNDSTDDYPFDSEVPEVVSSQEGYPSGFSDIDFMSDDNEYYEFSDGSDLFDYDDEYYEFSDGSDLFGYEYYD